MIKERVSPKENIKGVEITLGREEITRLEIFRNECEVYVPRIKDLLPNKEDSGPVESLLISQYYLLDSLKNISEQMVDCFKKSTEFRIIAAGNFKKGNEGIFFEPGQGGKVEGDVGWRKFNHLFFYVCNQQYEKIEAIKENLRNRKTVILKYDKNKD